MVSVIIATKGFSAAAAVWRMNVSQEEKIKTFLWVCFNLIKRSIKLTDFSEEYEVDEHSSWVNYAAWRNRKPL